MNCLWEDFLSNNILHEKEHIMSILSLDVSNHVATITIESPPANALSSQLLSELNDKLNGIGHDANVKAVIIRGEGNFFSAGADIKEFTSLQAEGEHEKLAKKGQEIFNRMEHFPVPIIAAIHGAALGGGLELSMACHMRIVGENAKLGLPELTLGIIPGFAGTQRLTQHVGHAKAYELILTGEPISGKKAAELGLANEAVSDEEVYEQANVLAKKIAVKSRPTVTKVMELVPYAKFHSFEAGVAAEAKAFGEIFGNEDAKEGITAFIEKRKAEFQDK